MKSLFLIASFLIATPSNADMQSLINNWKLYNETVIDLKNNPQKYGLKVAPQIDNSNQVAPKDLRTIRRGVLNLEIAIKLMDCNANNRKLCSNQLAQKGAK
jgi:hypothetical protein